ncbi:MAG TPA: response regulator [Nitrospirales bacterium]|nr:response regulator [Nitrospirales bacterium]
MKNASSRILLVDDDGLNMDVLVECLRDEPYELVQAHDGEQALAYLKQDQQGFHAMVLDRMMPGMNGLDLVAHVKADEHLQCLPVVMQTSAASPQEICEGIEAGVFFYLTKPFDQQLLLRIVSAAVEEGLKWKRIFRNLSQQSQIVELLQEGRFHIRTMEEAYDLAFLLGRACPNPEKVVFGLNELLANGVEHGNLGIGFDEKTALQARGAWEEEIQHRMTLPRYAHRVVDVLFERLLDCIQVTITDQGDGFDWRKYEQINPERILESHGRGIAMAKALSFSRVEYRGTGNQVVCEIKPESLAGPRKDEVVLESPMGSSQ